MQWSVSHAQFSIIFEWTPASNLIAMYVRLIAVSIVQQLNDLNDDILGEIYSWKLLLCVNTEQGVKSCVGNDNGSIAYTKQ